jgi:hypothetical protein
MIQINKYNHINKSNGIMIIQIFSTMKKIKDKGIQMQIQIIIQIKVKLMVKVMH